MFSSEIKKLTSQMGIDDKIKILVADHNLRCDTKQEKWLLTSQESQKMIDDIHKDSRSSAKLKATFDKYHLCLFLMFDIRSAHDNFILKRMIFVMTNMIMAAVGQADDLMSFMIHDLVTGSIKEPEKAAEKFEELAEHYNTKKGHYLKKYNHFSEVEDGREWVPNLEFQKILPIVIDSVKRYRFVKHQVDYLIEISGVNLTEGTMAREIEGYDQDVDDFIEHASDMVRIYDMFEKDGYLKNLNASDKEFLELITDISKACELSEERKEKAEESARDLLKDTPKLLR